MSDIHKAGILLGFVVAALIGFAILPIAQATLWLIFLVIGFPISVVFFSNQAVRFSPSEMIEIYKEAINALPNLIKRPDRKDPE